MVKPLSNHRLFKTNDLDEARFRVSEVYCDHVLEATHSTLLNACHHHAPFGNISLNYMQYGPEVIIEPGQLEDFYLLQLPIQGAADISCDDHHFHTERGVASVINPLSYTKMVWRDGCQMILIQIKKQAVEQCMASLLGHPLEKELKFSSVMDQKKAQHAAWWRPVFFILSELDKETHSYQDEPVREAVEKSLIKSLICSLDNNYSQALLENGNQIAPKHVRSAENYIQENYSQTITVEDLIAATGVSARCLFEGFKRFRNTTPMKHVLQTRLANVRETLLDPRQKGTVTQIATAHGFTQLGRFSVVYKEVFGESPSETLKNSHLNSIPTTH